MRQISTEFLAGSSQWMLGSEPAVVFKKWCASVRVKSDNNKNQLKIFGTNKSTI